MSSSGNVRDFLKASAIYGIIGGARSFIEFLLLPVYAKYLSPAEFGVFDIVMLFVMIGGVTAMLELGNGVFRFYFDDDSKVHHKKVVTSAFFFMIFNGAIIFAVFALSSEYLARSIFDSSLKGVLFTLVGLHILLNTAVTIPVNLLRVKNRPGKFTLISLFQIAVGIIGIVVFVVYMRMGVAGILTARIVAMVPTFFLAYYASDREICLSVDLSLLKRMLKYSLPLIPAGVAIWGINGLNRLFMLHYLSLDQIGLFSVSARFVVIITLSVIAFQLAWPHFSLSKMNDADSSRTFGDIFNIVTAGGFWLVIGVTLFAGPVIRLWMTPEYSGASAAVLPLALGMFMYGIFYFFSTGSVFAKATSRILTPIAAAVAVNVVLNLIITPRYGFVGTAWVTAVSYLTMMVTMIISARKHDFVALDRLRIGKLVAVSLPFVVVSGLLARQYSFYMLTIKIIVFTTFPLLLILAGFIRWPVMDSYVENIAGVPAENVEELNRCVELPVE